MPDPQGGKMPEPEPRPEPPADPDRPAAWLAREFPLPKEEG